MSIQRNSHSEKVKILRLREVDMCSHIFCQRRNFSLNHGFMGSSFPNLWNCWSFNLLKAQHSVWRNVIATQTLPRLAGQVQPWLLSLRYRASTPTWCLKLFQTSFALVICAHSISFTVQRNLRLVTGVCMPNAFH